MRGKIVFVNEVISAIAYLKAAHNYLNDLPYHTLFIYETLGMHGFDKANKLLIEILKEYGTIASRMKSIEGLNICSETNHDASMILYDAQQNVDYLLGILSQLKKEEKKLVKKN